jgi:hypothetical protein
MNNIRIPWLYVSLVIAQALHSLEEVFTGLWRWLEIATSGLHDRFAAIPILRGDERVFVLANVVIVLVMASLLPSLFREQPWALRVATWITAIEVINGMAHLIEAIVMGSYFPGVVAGTVLLVCAAIYLVSIRLERRQQWA